ncbi:hypothetical protein HIM_04808 [Hirsutella minnesotensis 3608]|uniref:Uncharacterized protein n=1 Tax=Hirsutella minnesotensis 3608 TaxID=1043627 RepID=A0A0F7ZKV0_9HYPO|nr:hypothetical protein HIM_04808 [Hirsutella minnesotensis 3608]
MGNLYSRPSTPAGCWWFGQGWTTGRQLFPTQAWSRLQQYKWDCDCHKHLACLWGEPTRPPLKEFLDAFLPQQVYEACPELQKLPPPRLRETWNDATPDEIPRWRPFKHGKRGLEDAIQEEPSHVDHLLWAIELLPKHKRSMVEAKYGIGDTQQGSLVKRTTNTTLTGLDANPQLILEVLLADPSTQGQMVIGSLPTSMGDSIMRCAERSVLGTLDRVASKHQELHGSYVDSLQRIVGAWTDHAPPVAASSPTLISDLLCDHIYQQAVFDVEQRDLDQRLIATYDEVGDALDLKFAFHGDTPVLQSLGSALVASEHLNWTESHMATVFGSEMPALAVGFGFLMLLLHGKTIE